MTILNTIMLIWMSKEPNGGACTAAVALSDGFKEIGGKLNNYRLTSVGLSVALNILKYDVVRDVTTRRGEYPRAQNLRPQ